MIAEIATEIYKDEELAARCKKLAAEIDEGIKKFGIVEDPDFGKIYAYETDGLGNYNLMDDANVPSLMSIPYLGYCDASDPIYQNTRKFILSKKNPYYYEGKVLKGIGSPHTPENRVWPIAIVLQGLTSDSKEEIEEILDMLVNSHAGTFFMHESINGHLSCFPDLAIVKNCFSKHGVCCSVAKSCLTICDPIDCSASGFPVLHYLPEFAQTHTH